MPNEPADRRSNRRAWGEPVETVQRGDRELHVPEAAIRAESDPNRMLSRRSPIGRSRPSLVSRDYQPRTGGPELVASWPLGPTPTQSGLGDHPWEVAETEYVTLQKNFLALPFVAPIECSLLYLNFCGRGRTGPGDETLTLRLTTDHLERSGKPYETEIDLSDAEGEYFLSPMVEFAPDTGDYRPGHDIVSGYEFQAKVSGGTGYVDQGSAVQLWSE